MTNKHKFLDSFLASTVFITATALYSYLALLADSEGRLDGNMFLVFLANNFSIMFPLTLLSKNIADNYSVFILFWLLNIILYSIVISSFLYRLIKKKSSFKTFTTTHISLWIAILPLVIFVVMLLFGR